MGLTVPKVYATLTEQDIQYTEKDFSNGVSLNSAVAAVLNADPDFSAVLKAKSFGGKFPMLVSAPAYEIEATAEGPNLVDPTGTEAD